MPFRKTKSIVPLCDRISEHYCDLDAEELLSILPDTADNDHKPMATRKKYFLIGNDSEGPDEHHKGEISPLLEAWPAGKAVLDKFPGKIVRCHLSIMEPGGVLRVHRDGYTLKGEKAPGFQLFDTTLRFHIPLTSTDKSMNFVRGRFFKKKPNELWVFNNMVPHSAINLDDATPRMHLIFDVEPNYRTMKLAFSGESGLGYEDWDFFEKHWPKGSKVRGCMAEFEAA